MNAVPVESSRYTVVNTDGQIQGMNFQKVKNVRADEVNRAKSVTIMWSINTITPGIESALNFLSLLPACASKKNDDEKRPPIIYIG